MLTLPQPLTILTQINMSIKFEASVFETVVTRAAYRQP